MAEIATAPPPKTERVPNDKILGRVSASLAGERLSTGERARLRRPVFQEGWPGRATAYRLVGEAARDYEGLESLSELRLRQWEVLIHAMAVLVGTARKPPHRWDKPAGAAIHETGWSEARFLRLLSTEGESLDHAVVRLAHFLAQKDVALDWRPLVWLVLGRGRDDASRRARLQLAQSYYGAETKKSKSEGEGA